MKQLKQLTKYLIKPKKIRKHIDRVNVFISIFCLTVLGILSYLVAHESIRSWDEEVLVTIKNILPEWFIYVAKVSYFLGEAEVTVFFVLFCLIYLVWKKYWCEAQVVAISCLSVLLLIDKVFKPFFRIRRPLGRLVSEITGYSYPSGHAAGNLLFYFLVAYIAAKIAPRYKVWFYGLATVAIGLMGVSIAYLRVHWISDVLASYCLGYILFTIAIVLLESSLPNKLQEDENEKGVRF